MWFSSGRSWEISPFLKSNPHQLLDLLIDQGFPSRSRGSPDLSFWMFLSRLPSCSGVVVVDLIKRCPIIAKEVNHAGNQDLNSCGYGQVFMSEVSLGERPIFIRVKVKVFNVE
jgi:hypothetical protein